MQSCNIGRIDETLAGRVYTYLQKYPDALCLGAVFPLLPSDAQTRIYKQSIESCAFTTLIAIIAARPDLAISAHETIMQAIVPKQPRLDALDCLIEYSKHYLIEIPDLWLDTSTHVHERLCELAASQPPNDEILRILAQWCTNSTSYSVRAKALESLGCWVLLDEYKPSYLAIVDALRDKSSPVRAKATWAFANLCVKCRDWCPDDPRILNGLQVAFVDPKVASNACRAFGEYIETMPSEKLVDAFVSCFSHKDPKTQWNAFASLAKVLNRISAIPYIESKNATSTEWSISGFADELVERIPAVPRSMLRVITNGIESNNLKVKTQARLAILQIAPGIAPHNLLAEWARALAALDARVELEHIQKCARHQGLSDIAAQIGIYCCRMDQQPNLAGFKLGDSSD